MGNWTKKSGRRLRDAVMTITRDRRWVVPFLQAAADKYERNAADLVRKAFCVRFTDRPHEKFLGSAGCHEKQKWDKVQFRIPERMAWLSEALDAEAKRQKRSPGDVLFIAFCEVYGADFPELRAMYEKWREINVMEAA